jgi:hypothetical protein
MHLPGVGRAMDTLVFVDMRFAGLLDWALLGHGGGMQA